MRAQELVGRHGELARIDSVLARLPAGGGGLVVRGQAGIGKTALLEAARARAQARSVLLLTTTAAESEAHLPFAALHELLHPYEDQFALLLPGPRAALESALGRRVGPPSDIFLVGLGVLQVLSELGTGLGALVVIDDAHWMDASTAQVLAFAARRVASDPVVMLFAQRTGLPSPLDDANLPVLEVPALSRRDADTLLDSARPGLPAAARRRIGALAEGNPLALIELPAQADAADPIAPVDLNDRLRRAFAVRWRTLGTAAGAALLVAAANDGASVSEVLSAMGEYRGGLPVSATTLDDVASTGAVTIQGDTIRFRHPLVRSGVVVDASDDDLRAAHAALASSLRVRAPERAAWHLAASVTGPDDDAASALDEVAARARAQGDAEVELRALARAAALTADADGRAPRLLRAAEIAIELGRPDTASALAARLDPAVLDANQGARFALLRDSLDPGVHTAPRVAGLASHALAIVAANPDLAVRLILAAGVHLTTTSFAIDAAPARRAAEALAATLGDDDPRTVAVFAVVDPLHSSDRVRERIAALDPLRLDPADEVLVATTAFVLDADPGLAALQAAVIDGHRMRGQLRTVASMRVVHCWTAITLADWPLAIQAADEGARLAQDAGSAQWEAGSLIATAMIAAFRGDGASAREAIRASELLAASRGAQDVLTGIQLTKGVDHIARGEYDEATSALKRVFDPSDASFHPVQSAWSLGDLAEAAAHSGRLEEVRGILEDGRSVAVSTPWQRMATEYAQPFVEADPNAAEAAFVAALAGGVARWPTYRVRMLVEYGVWLRRRRRITEARERLRAARDQADALGLHPWSQLARRELRAAGEESSEARVAAWEALSPQELQVAELAAAGLSNREIGERLFLSHRTVGSHLYRIFPKLGVTSRAQLGVVLGLPGRDRGPSAGPEEPTAGSPD